MKTTLVSYFFFVRGSILKRLQFSGVSWRCWSFFSNVSRTVRPRTASTVDFCSFGSSAWIIFPRPSVNVGVCTEDWSDVEATEFAEDGADAVLREGKDVEGEPLPLRTPPPEEDSPSVPWWWRPLVMGMVATEPRARGSGSGCTGRVNRPPDDDCVAWFSDWRGFLLLDEKRMPARLGLARWRANCFSW